LGLSGRLILLVAASLIPMIAIQAYTQFDLRRAREDELRTNVLQMAQRVASEEQRVIEGIRQLLETLVELKEIRSGDAQGCASLFAQVRRRFEGIQAFAVTAKDGTIFCLSTPTSDKTAGSLADRAYFQQAMQSGAFAVGQYSIGKFTHRRVQSFALPYLDLNGERGGVVAISLSLDWLATQFDATHWNDDQIFSIVDRDGTVLVRQPNYEGTVGKKLPTDLWALAASAAAPTTRESSATFDSVARIIGFIPPKIGPGGLCVAVGISRASAFADLNAATWRAAFWTLVATLAALVVAVLFGERLIRRPIGRLVATTRQWRAGNYKARAALGGSSEVEQLGEAFDDMAQVVEQSLAHKDLLLRELSHRVMNSLQAIASLLSLQGRSMRDAEARNHFTNAVARINSMALAYRRMQSAGGVETVEFAAFLRELCHDLSRSMMRGTNACTVEADPVVLVPDQATLLALIVNELVTNALKHGSGALARVTVRLHCGPAGCRLAVRNAGALPADYDPSVNRGFGMQMVSRLARQLHGTLEAGSTNGETEFAVTFEPRAPQPTTLTAATAEVA
jgi:two-component sensor histidine kinase